MKQDKKEIEERRTSLRLELQTIVDSAKNISGDILMASFNARKARVSLQPKSRQAVVQSEDVIFANYTAQDGKKYQIIVVGMDPIDQEREKAHERYLAGRKSLTPNPTGNRKY